MAKGAGTKAQGNGLHTAVIINLAFLRGDTANSKGFFAVSLPLYRGNLQSGKKIQPAKK